MRHLNFFALLFVGLIFSCKTTAPQATNNLENALLWKVEREDIRPSYLYGTIHMLPKDDFSLSDETKEAFGMMDQLVDMDDPEMLASMMQYAAMEEGNSLKEMMSEETYLMIDEILQQNMGMGLAMLDNMKPFMFSGMLIPSFMEEVASYEETFVAMAKQQDKETLGIETVADQMKAIDYTSYEEQVADLEEMMMNQEETIDMFSSMVALYKEGEISDLHDMVKSEYEDESALNAMLYERNRNWVSAIPDLCAEKSSFIAVGAGHLGGEQGVVRLLRKEGFKVTPVYY